MLIAVFLISIIFILIFKKINLRIGLKGNDVNKGKKTIVPESLGIALMFSFGIGVLLSGVQIDEKVIWFLAGIIIFTLLGFLDDLSKFRRKAVSWKTRALLVLTASVFFAVRLIPESFFLAAILIIGLISFHNSFAGLNGLEAGTTLIVALLLLFIIPAEFLLLNMVFIAVLIAFLAFNFYPAKVFPGDSGSFFFGSTIALLLIISGIIRIEFFLFYSPQIIDFFFLKLMSNPKDVSQKNQKPYELINNKLSVPKNNKTNDFAKLILKKLGALSERKLVLTMLFVVLINCLFWYFVLY